MVVRSNATPYDMAQRARQEFQGKTMVGVVLNGISDDRLLFAVLLRSLRERSRSKSQGTPVIRLFNVYYPVRSLILLAVETLVVFSSFLLGMIVAVPRRSLHCSELRSRVSENSRCHRAGSDLLALVRPVRRRPDLNATGELYFRLLLVPGLARPTALPQLDFFPTILDRQQRLVDWSGPSYGRAAGVAGCLSWLLQQPFLQERVYVLGTGERAQRLVQGLRTAQELGVRRVGWSGTMEGALTARVGGRIISMEVTSHPAGASRDRCHAGPAGNAFPWKSCCTCG